MYYLVETPGKKRSRFKHLVLKGSSAIVKGFFVPQFLSGLLNSLNWLNYEVTNILQNYIFLGILCIDMSDVHHKHGTYDSCVLVRVTSSWASFRWGK